MIYLEFHLPSPLELPIFDKGEGDDLVHRYHVGGSSGTSTGVPETVTLSFRPSSEFLECEGRLNYY